MTDDLPRVQSTTTADAGLALVKLIVSTDRRGGGLGCLFRELPTADVGVDGHVEMVVEDENGSPSATGRIISVQVKSGKNYFERQDEGSWHVYVRKSTMNYWRAHSLPVILILANLDEKRCYWVRADSEGHRETEQGYRLVVSKRAELGADAYRELSEIAENTTEAGRRLARLQGELPLMRALAAGEAVSVDLGHWWNRSSGRTDVVVGYSRPGKMTEGPEGLEPVESFMIFGGGGTRDVVETLFPWAEAQLDRDFLEMKEDEWYDEYLAATGTYDSEDGVYIDVLGTFDASGYYDDDEDPAPYAEAAGEIGYYRYSLRLNDLGRSFLSVSEFLVVDDQGA